VGWSSFDLDDNIGVWSVSNTRNNDTIFAYESTDDELKYSHSDCANPPILSIKKNMTVVKMRIVRTVHRMR